MDWGDLLKRSKKNRYRNRWYEKIKKDEVRWEERLAKGGLLTKKIKPPIKDKRLFQNYANDISKMDSAQVFLLLMNASK
jgi:hypothetical protein